MISPETTEYVLIALFSIVLFIYRIRWRQRFPRAGYDTWYHITAARAIRRNGFHIPTRTGQHFNKGIWDYPPFFPYILSLLPDGVLVRFNYVLPPVFDLLCFLTISFFVMLSGFGVAGIILASLIYISTPIIAIDVMQHTTPRPLGNFLFNLALILQLHSFLTGDWRAMILSVIPVTLIFLTHKFTLQAFVMISIALAMFTRNLGFILVPAIAFCLAVVVTGGHYLVVLRGHLAFLNYYRTRGRLKYPRMYAVDRNRFLKLVRLDSTASPALLFLPLVLLLGIRPDVFLFLAILFVLIYAVVSLNQLLFLGEPERYFELATLPVVMIAIALFSRIGVLYFAPLLALTSLIGFLRIHRELRSREELIRDKNAAFEHYADDELLDACSFMRSYPGDRILTVPEYMQGGAFYYTGKLTQGTESAYEYGNYMKEFPANPDTLVELVRKYKVDMVLMGKAASKDYDMSFAVIAFENDRYIVYDTRKSAGNPGAEFGRT